MKKILIYGTGENAKYSMNKIKSFGGEILGFCETQKKRSHFEGLPVYNVDDINELFFDEIYIANKHIETLEKIIAMNVPKEKIVLDFGNIHGDNHLLLSYLKNNNYNLDIRCNAPLVVTRCMSYQKNIPHTNKVNFNNNHVLFNDDYVRYGTLELLAKECLAYNIPGDVAELGVYRGKFASLLNTCFPTKQLHLFDTFEGFDERDTSYETNFSCSKPGTHGDTSVDIVMKLMPNPEKISVYKGFFPDTIPNQELSFAFVSIDCDLYKPIYAGLEYFYFRLSPRGYIMLHDYNGGYGKGVHAAIEEFEKKHSLQLIKIPIPDEGGSVVISK